LVHIDLETGRKHQIRAQLAHLGHPICGDMKYGAPQAFKLRDVALHAYYLSFNHPVTNSKLIFTAPPPEQWKKYFGEDLYKTADALK
jgi:23S rRNA pseudouridine1911/1915/1917 synthase